MVSDTGAPFGDAAPPDEGADTPLSSEKSPQVRPWMSKVPYRRRHSAGQEDEEAAADAARLQGPPGRHRSDVALADLLAEALMAYQNGRRSQLAAEQVASAAPGTTPRPEPASQPERPIPVPERPKLVQAEQLEPKPGQAEQAEWPEPKPAHTGQPEPDPSVTQPTRVQEPPTSPIPVSQVLLDSGDPLGYPYPAMVPPSLVGVPPHQVWREPGTF